MDKERLLLTVGRALDGRLLAVITRGAHPQFPDQEGVCEVLDVEEVRSRAEAKAWFRKAKKTRPWETRQ